MWFLYCLCAYTCAKKGAGFPHACGRLLAKKDAMNLDPFSYLTDNSVTKDAAIRDLAASWYGVVKTFSIIGLLITIVACGISLAVTKNSRRREEVKRSILVKGAVFCGICAFAFFIGQVASITAGFAR